MKQTRFHPILSSLAIGALLFFALPGSASSAPLRQQADNPAPPDQVVKLIFIHHSTGENWLRDDYGGLGQALAENNYFVSDTNYGWGPDSIGDRTNIPNWTEWFAGEQTPTYMNALFSESGQNSEYTRLPNDPGSENQVILFKSCFPNSALEGNPDDPPGSYEEMTVSGAKYVYNRILEYFASRPDKLFVVITAPPLTDSTYADNARAFNQWLVNDWLAENNYTLPNVAVFDFYNVLTAKDAHHWFHDGEIQHIVTNRNTEYYPSGDDHPSAGGSQKAADEFIPLLNIFYHRWADGQTDQPPEATQAQIATATWTEIPPVSSGTGGLVADFDSLTPSLNAYWDEATSTRLTCAPSSDAAYEGTSSLKIDFNVVAGSWSTCVLSFDDPQDWSSGPGLWFALHASQPGLPYNIIIYAGSPDNQETYLDSATTPTDSAGGWATIEIPWAEFHRADWEADAGTPFARPGQILGIAFGFDGLDSGNNTGTVWVDSISYLGAATPVGESSTPQPQPEPDGGGGLPCFGSIALPMMFFALALVFRKLVSLLR